MPCFFYFLLLPKPGAVSSGFLKQALFVIISLLCIKMAEFNDGSSLRFYYSDPSLFWR